PGAGGRGSPGLAVARRRLGHQAPQPGSLPGGRPHRRKGAGRDRRVGSVHVAPKSQVDSPPIDLTAAEARSRLDAILDLSHDAILAISLDGTIIAWNRAAERIYGYPAEAIVGKPLSILVPPENIHELASLYPGIARGGTIEQFETVRVRSDGVRIDVSLSIAPIRNGSGKAVGALAISRDITAIQRVIKEAAQSSEKLSDR